MYGISKTNALKRPGKTLKTQDKDKHEQDKKNSSSGLHVRFLNSFSDMCRPSFESQQ